MSATTVSKTRTTAKPTRPKLADISLTRDLYAEMCAAFGFDPLAVR